MLAETRNHILKFTLPSPGEDSACTQHRNDSKHKIFSAFGSLTDMTDLILTCFWLPRDSCTFSIFIISVDRI